MRRLRFPRLGWSIVPVLLPGVLVVFFGFRGGGYFAGSPAFVAALLTVVVAARIVTAESPFAGVNRASLVVVGALALYAAWCLASASWSHSASRAQIEYDRALLYLLLAFVIVCAPTSHNRMRWAVRALTAATVVICTAALVSRVLPHVLPTTHIAQYNRLAYPLTYWNALGLLSALALAMCLHGTSSTREPRVVRVLAAGAMPIVAVTLFFTFSRGGIAAAALALVAYLAVARPRSAPTALAASAPACAIALTVAYDAHQLGGSTIITDSAVAEGRTVAWVVAACCVAAGLVRLALLPVDARLAAISVTPTLRRRARTAVALVLAVGVVAALAMGAVGAVRKQYRGFVLDKPVAVRDFRARLSEAGANGRVAEWRVSLNAFSAAPLTGSGAGTFAVVWAQHRPSIEEVFDGHSLYLETLGELGIPGIVFIVVLVGVLLLVPLRRARGPDRDVYAVAFAVGLAWAVHAGVDWDWEMPAVTTIPLALGALACARRTPWRAAPVPGGLARIVLGLACLFLAIAPASVALSQGRLNAAAKAFKRGDCARAIDSSLAASDAASTRPEPFDLIGFCDARLGYDALAIRALEAAVNRDPRNWTHWYGLALVREHAGVDGRGAARTALRLDPREPVVRAAVAALSSTNPARRRAFAANAPLPVR